MNTTNPTFTRRDILCAAAGATIALTVPNTTRATPNVWVDLKGWPLEGHGWREEPRQFHYDRLPSRARSVVPVPVWILNHSSAGLCFRFTTNAQILALRGALSRPAYGLWNMPKSGTSALELFKLTQDAGWRSITTLVPSETPTVLHKAPPNGPPQQFLLYLPLYNGIERLELGVPEGATLTPVTTTKAPLVCYGTSITQGACATSAGQCWTAIVGRRLEREVINLGFSGRGRMDPGVRDLLAELKPCAYVIACLPNMWRMEPRLITKRTTLLVQTLRKQRPTTPILLVEDREFDTIATGSRPRHKITRTRAAQHRAFKALQKEQVPGLFYVKSESKPLKRCSKDGIHPNAHGMKVYADRIESALKTIPLNSRFEPTLLRPMP